MNPKQCYATLEIHEHAGKEEIRQAYRDLVTIWHPDQYQGNPRLQEKATEKLKELNAAYETLTTHGKASPTGPTRDQRPSERRAEKFTRPGKGPQAGPLKRKRPLAVWIILLLAVAITALALYSRWPFPLPGTTRQGPIVNGGSSIHALAAARLASEQVAGLQRELVLMGYNSGTADGKMGPRTLKAAQQFAMDFKVNHDGDFVESLLAASSRQAAVTRLHTDWPGIFKNRDFHSWIDLQKIATPDVCRNVLASGSAAQVSNLVYSYLFDREKPDALELPKTGIVQKRIRQGMAPLNINTRFEGRHFFIKLFKMPEQKEVLSTFIRSGDMLKLRIPLGVYTLKYAVGNTWYGTQWLFGSDTVFSRIEKDIEFSFEGNEISGYSIELYIEPKLLSKKTKNYTFDF